MDFICNMATVFSKHSEVARYPTTSLCFLFVAQLRMSHFFMSSLMKKLMFLWMKSTLIGSSEHQLIQIQV